MIFYNSKEKNRCLEIINRRFSDDVIIIDPSDYSFSHESIKFYYRLIDKASIVIYIPIMEYVTAGVYDEIKYALDAGKKVYKISGGDIKLVENIEEDVLDIETTKILYRILNLVDEYLLSLELESISKNYHVKRIEALKNIL